MNRNYEDEIIQETDANEGASSGKGGKSEKFIRICIAAVIAAVVVIAVLASVVITMGRLGKEDETTTLPPADVTTTAPVEITTAPEEKYEPGQYTVNVGGNGKLNLRKDPSKDGEQILAIDNATLLTITEISYDPTAEPDSQYWGKTVYKGWDAWVSMKYLANAYSESVVTPEEVTTALGEATTVAGEVSATTEEKTTAAEEKTTASSITGTTAPAVSTTAPATSTTAPAVSTTAPAVSTTAASTENTSSGAGGATTTGTYTVTADSYLNMRENHDVASLSIVQVPHGATVTVVDVYHDADSTNPYAKYWGKITYGGKTGWVAMGYLK